MFRNAGVLFILFLIGSSLSYGQSPLKWSGTGIEASFWTGKMFKHTSKFTGTLPKHSFAYELNFLKQTYGQKDWHQRRNFPQIGLGFMMIDYQDPNVYGTVWGIYPTIQIPLWKKGKVDWNLNAGMGVGYVTKIFQRTPSPNLENVAIGSHWNNVSPFSTKLRWRLDAHWDVHAGVSFVHVSSAAFQQPNLGINMWGVQMGFRYFPVTNQPTLIKKNLQPLRNRWLISGRYSMAFIEKIPADGPIYPVYTGALFTSKRYWSKNKVFGGVDYSYNSGVYVFLKSIEDQKGSEKSAASSLAVFAGNEFLLGRVGVVFQLGFYLKEFYKTHEQFYQKIGGNFYFYQSEKGPVKEVYGTVLLKTHKTVAELCEIGIGVSF